MSESPASAPAYEIVRARTPEEIQQCIDIRIAVFHAEQGFPLDTEVDAYDALHTTAHFLLRLTGPDTGTAVPAGTIRATRPAGAHYYKLTRLAVHAPYRAHRLGAALARALHAWVVADARAGANAHAQAHAEVVAHSQLPAMGFYAKLGYVPEGPTFDEDGAPHQKMVLRLPL